MGTVTDEDLIREPEDHASFVTVTHGMRGYFAVLMWWDPEGGFWEPWQTGIGSYRTADEAFREARDWAAAEDIEARR